MDNFWYNIKCFFFPSQRWLTRNIPNTWKDKPELIRDILFECLVHYVEVEEENLKDYITMEDPDFGRKKKHQKIWQAYKNIKEELPNLIKEYESLCEKDYDKKDYYYRIDNIQKINELREKIDRLEQETVLSIVEVRESLWN